VIHSGDLLSALLDGQLDASEAAEVREHLAGCDLCTQELEDVRHARRLVRELPAVEPPDWFLAELLAGDDVVPLGTRGTRRRGALVNIGASVAAGILLLVLSSSQLGPRSVSPEVDGAVERHASTVSALLGSTGGARLVPPHEVPPTTAPERDASNLPAPYAAPDTLAGYELVHAYRSPGGVHLLYEHDDFGLSVFEVQGNVDWGALPDGGTRLSLAGHRAWRMDDDPADGRLVVFEDDGMVVIVVGDEPGDAVLDAAAELPSARNLPLPTRLRRAMARAFEALSPAP